MRTTPTRAHLRRLLAVLATAGLLAAACGNDDDGAAPDTDGDRPAAPADGDTGEFQPLEGVPGVTDEEIRVAVMGTGPANPLGYCLLDCYQAGVQAYFDYINDQGGIHGRDLVIHRVADDEFAQTQVTLIELIDDSSIFAIFGAPLLYDGYADVGRSDVPLYTTFPASPDADGHENIYVPSGTICIDCPNPTQAFAAQLVGSSTVASLGFGISQVSKDCAAQNQENIEIFGPGAGVSFGYLNDELAFGFTSVAPEVTAMGNAGVDYVATCIDQTSVLTLEQELHRQGLADVVVSLPQGYGDDEYLSGNADLLEGDILSVAYRPVEADIPEGSLIEEMVDRLEQVDQVNDYAIQGWMGADLFVTGLLAAGPQFDRAAVIGATNEITDWNAGGLLPFGVDWTTAHDAPTPETEYTICSAFLLVEGGELVLQGDPAEPLFCWDMPLTEYEEPYTVG